MKSALVLLVALAAFSATAQNTNSSAASGTDPLNQPAKPALTNAPAPALSSTNLVGTTAAEPTWHIQVPLATAESALTLKEVRPNQVISGRLLYSGVAVEAVKTRRPWQLVNPLSPAKYGTPEDNVARDPINGRVSGLKFLAIHF